MHFTLILNFIKTDQIPPDHNVFNLIFIIYIYLITRTHHDLNLHLHLSIPIYTHTYIFVHETVLQSKFNSTKMMNQQKFLPKRIILVRHGECAGNLDGEAYTTTPDYKLPITDGGISHAKLTGTKIRDVISDSGKLETGRFVFMYHLMIELDRI